MNRIIFFILAAVLTGGIVVSFELTGAQAFFVGGLFSVVFLALGRILDLLERDRD